MADGRRVMAPSNHDAARRLPNSAQARTDAEVIRYDIGHTSVGTVLIAVSDYGIVAIAIREHPDEDALTAALRGRFRNAVLRRDHVGTRDALEAVVAFVETPKANIALPLDIRGTEFQRRVWTAVMEVPFAKTTTFSEIARKVGSPRAVRAVGSACSQNPLEFAIPCHRVLRSDSSYSGGSAWGDLRQSTIVRREAQSAVTTGAEHVGLGAKP
jgi:AraC family transcriptional regulator, regulatory protein of adaptative response / methylated-DNA-[protein]-cysteine methyltransferase